MSKEVPISQSRWYCISGWRLRF